MEETAILSGKRVLLVDDERDVLDTLSEILDVCEIDTASSFSAASKKLYENRYDAVILDIMGVNGYELLEIANLSGMPTLILTAHALSPDHLIRSLKCGACAYLPKYKMSEIDGYLAGLIQSHAEGGKKTCEWLDDMEPYYTEKFGANWKEKDRLFWEDFYSNFSLPEDDCSDASDPDR
jgi:CheY-like chemotaxis protein